MSQTSKCPGEDVLINYAQGKLSRAENDSFQKHLAACQKCTDALEWLTLHILPRLGKPDDGEGDESSNVASTIPVVTGRTNSEPSDDGGKFSAFDFAILKPSTTPGSLGLIGKYEVISVIDRGGSSVILKGVDPTLGRFVAIKALNQNNAQEEKGRLRFAREARAAALISHPNVVTVHGLEEQGGIPFIVMEYVAGGSLSRAIRRKGRFDAATTILYGAQIAAGLAAAHLSGVIHRDIKPANLLLDRSSGRLRITDFGVARIVSDESQLTSQGHVVGTPGYMAPEQVEGESVDFRTDLFGTGCVLYEMISGIAPFRGQSYLEINQNVLEESVESLATIVPSIPERLSDIVERLLKKDPDDRIQDAMELADLLQQALDC